VANEIKLTIKVDDNGSLQIVAKDADKAAKSLGGVATATDRVSKSKDGLHVRQNKFNKLEKGTAQLTANSTKAFSKQAQTLGGTLVPAYATLAANIFALTALFGALQRAAAFEQLQQGLISVGAAAGQNLPYVAKQLKEITGAAVSAKEAMSAVALGTSAGFSTKQLEDLTKVAKGASLALGRNLEDALNRLVRGTAKLEPEILDELGIMVRVDDAANKYAATLGKSVSQLTAFEKRQAFLNETIEQGLQKFSQIADTVDPNPYDQLAATFGDLQKAGFKLLNTVLVPLIEILSTSPTALAGAALLLGATIVDKIVPGLDQAINKQKTLAALSLRDAKQAQALQKKQIARQAKSIAADFLPKKAAEVFAGDTRSAKEYNLALTSLTKSEQIRQGWIRTWEAENKTLNAAKIRDQKMHIAVIQEQIKKVKELQAAELSNAAVTKATIGKQIATRQQFLLNKISDAGAVQGFGIAIKGAAHQWKSAKLGSIPGVMGKVSTSFKLAGASASLFGRALLTALPFIAIMTTVIGALIPLFEKLWGKGKVAKAVDEVTESFKSFRDASLSLSAALTSNLSDAAKFARGLKTHVGLIGQVESGFHAIAKAQRETVQEELTKKIEEQLRLQINIARLEDSTGLNTSQMQANAALLNSQRQALQGLNEEIDELRKTADRLDKTTGLKVIQAALNEITTMAPESQAALKSTVDTLNELKDLVSSGEIKTLPELFERLFAAMSNARNADSAITSARLSVTAFDKELSKLANKPTTVFDSLVKQAESLEAQLKAAGEAGHSGIKAFLENTPTLVTRLDHIRDSFGEMTDEEALAKLVQIFKEAQEVLVLYNGRIEEANVLFKALNEVADDHPGIMAKALDEERKLLLLRKQSLEVQIAAAKRTGNLEAETKLRKQLEAVETRLVNKQYEQEKIAEATAKQAKRILGYEAKKLTFTIQRVEAEQRLLETQAKASARLGGTDLSPITAVKIQRDFEEERLKNIQEQTRQRLATINVEYNLLDAQVALERIKAKNAGASDADLAAFDAYSKYLQDNRSAAVDAAEAQGKLNEASEMALRIESARAARIAEWQQKIESISITEESLRIAGLERLAIDEQLKGLAAEIEQKYEELNLLAKGTPEYKQKELEIQRILNKETQAQLDKIRAIADLRRKLGGENFGAAADVVANLEQAATKITKDTPIAETLGAITTSMQPLLEQLKAISPEGEVYSAAISGVFNMSEAWLTAFESMSEGGNKLTGVLTGVAATINAISQIQIAASNQAVSAIDREIEAEKKRDGKSAQSLAKISALEKKKEKEKRKAFEINKKMQMAQTVISTITAAMGAYSSLSAIPIVGPALGAAAAAVISAIGAAQLAAIASTSFEGGSGGVPNSGPSKIALGERSSTIDVARSRSPAGELAYLRGEQGVGNTGAANYVPIPSFTGRATGGNTAFMVGEQGPELFIPDRPGTIVPADETEKVGGQLNVNFSINTIDTQGMQDALVKQRGNIIGMIREAANSRGELFLENINIREDDAL